MGHWSGRHDRYASEGVVVLNDREHVEAAAIIRRLLDVAEHFGCDEEAKVAARQWLVENRPEPGVYIAALTAAATDPRRNEAPDA